MRTVTSVNELRLIAVHLMGNIYFSTDSTDKLGALLRAWQPALFSKAHLSNLVELGHLTYKVVRVRNRRRSRIHVVVVVVVVVWTMIIKSESLKLYFATP